MKMKNLSEAPLVELPGGAVRSTLAYNDEAMLCRFRVKKGMQVPLHSHRASQVGYVLSGALRCMVSGEDGFEVRAGDSYAFNPHEEHGAEALEDAEILEFFTPPREDYMDW